MNHLGTHIHILILFFSLLISSLYAYTPCSLSSTYKPTLIRRYSNDRLKTMLHVNNEKPGMESSQNEVLLKLNRRDVIQLSVATATALINPYSSSAGTDTQSIGSSNNDKTPLLSNYNLPQAFCCGRIAS